MKSILSSKTFWVNLIAGVVGATVYINPELLGALGIPQETQEKILRILGLVVMPVLNFILRLMTNQPVSVPGITKIVPFLLICMAMSGLASCAFVKDAKSRTSFEIVKRPTDLNDTVSLVGKFWGFGELVSNHIPPNSKVGAFWVEANKYCTLDLIRFPTESINDTIEVELTCHSSQKLIKGFTERFKK
jgi:hypothetical protein